MEIFDNLNSFILEFKNKISDYDIMQFKRNMYSLITESETSFLSSISSSDIYCKFIDNAIDNLNNISVDIDTLDDFFSKIYKSVYLDSKNITIPLLPDEDIDKIRPEYLQNIHVEFTHAVEKILENKMDKDNVEKLYVYDSKFFSTLKKQLVKTNLVTNSLRDFITNEDPVMVRVDNIFLQNNAIPFLRSYPQNLKDLNLTVTRVKNNISSSYENIVSVLNAIEKMDNIDKKTLRVLDYLSYNMVRQFMNMCAYVSAMTIRKISYYTYNMMSYMTLYNTIYNYFPEGDLILHESVIDGDLSDIDDTTLLNSIIDNNLSIILPHVQSAIGKKKMELANIVSKKYNRKLDYNQNINDDLYTYDKYPYAAINKILIDISNNLHKFEISSKDVNIVIDDVITSSGLEETFMSKYNDIISHIPDIEYYTSQASMGINDDGTVMIALYNDISHYEENIKIISSNASRCYKYIKALQDSYSINTNSIDNVTFNEIKSFLEQLMKNYKDFVLQVIKKILDRLDNLTSILDDEHEDHDMSEPEEYIPYDYSLESVLLEYDNIDMNNKIIFESMLREYNKLRNKIERGVNIVYEDVSQQTVDNNSSTTPKVEGNVQENNDKKENISSTDSNTSNNNSSNNTNSQDSKEKTDWIQTFIKWIQDKIHEFGIKARKMFNVDKAKIEEVEKKIDSLDVSNLTITKAKYEKTTEDNITREINSAITKINAITSDNVPAQLKENNSTARLYLFPNIPQKIGNITSESDIIKHYYTYGNTPEKTLMKYSSEDARNALREICSYCKAYGNMANNISKKIDELREKSVAKDTDIKKVSSNSDTNKNVSNNVVTHLCKTYTGSILSVIEAKYCDYMKILYAVFPKSKSKNVTNNTTNNENNTTENNK